MDLEALGRRIRQRREKQALRQADLASALRVSPQAVSKWERGENAPDITILAGLARMLDAPIEWLLEGGPADNETFEAVVLASSLAGFAERATQIGPRALAAWSNGIYYTVTEACRHKGGVPVKYVGDGFLCFFTGAERADRAVAAALRAKQSVDYDGLAMALDAGPIFLGTLGHPDYATTDILGAAVNTAFMCLPHATDMEPSRIALTNAVYALLSDKTAVVPRGTLSISGRTDAIDLFEPNSND